MKSRFAVASSFVALAALFGRAAPATGVCQPGEVRQTVVLSVSASEAQLPISLVASLTYDPSLVQLPDALRPRLRARANGAMLTPSIQHGALRLVAGKGGGLATGPLVDVEFDRCAGARAPTAADFGCRIDSCAGSGGALGDCTCSVGLP